MKTWKIFWGLGLIIVAVIIALDQFGIIAPLMGWFGEVSAIALIGGLLLLSIVIKALFKGNFTMVFFPLAFIFMIFEKNIAHIAGLENNDIIHNGLVLLIALLLTLGFSILFSSKKRRSNHGVSVEISNKDAESHFGASTVYVDCDNFSPSSIENSFGGCSIHFQNVESYKGECVLNVENNFGHMVINVPHSWAIKCTVENNFGRTESKNTDNGGPIIYIKGENNFGSLTVKHI